jgi:hypothetical protein
MQCGARGEQAALAIYQTGRVHAPLAPHRGALPAAPHHGGWWVGGSNTGNHESVIGQCPVAGVTLAKEHCNQDPERDTNNLVQIGPEAS